MKKHLLGLLFGLISISVIAEKIDGPANIRTEPKGELRFSLNDSVEVECTEIKNGWYEILVTIQLTAEQYDMHPLLLKKGTKISDMQGKEIGEILSDTHVYSQYTAGGAPGIPKWYAADLHGYTFKSNIKPESIIEPVLSNLIINNLDNLNFDFFENHLIEFNYRYGLRIPEYDSLRTFMVYEHSMDDPSPLDRIRLIFNENKKLIAVVHLRELDLPDFEIFEIERGRKLTILEQLDDKEKTKFIEKNKQAYWGID